MAAALRLRMEQDTDGTAELFAEVESGRFRGAGSAWFGVQQVAAFGERLATTYPLQAGVPYELAGGYWDAQATVLKQTHLSLRFYPIGALGEVGCRVLLASPFETNERAENQSSVAVELRTRYQALREFGESVVQLAAGSTGEVVLHANEP
jgi:hypothetical protein